MAEDSAAQSKFEIRKLYVKDASFESPMAPKVFTQEEIAPAIDIHLTIEHNALDPDNGFYEVVLGVTVTAKAGDTTMFLVEVQQGGVFEIKGVPEARLPLVLEIGCPNVLLPFAREAVADLVARGGFPQLLINPVNFEALYQHKQSQAEQAVKAPADNGNGADRAAGGSD